MRNNHMHKRSSASNCHTPIILLDTTGVLDLPTISEPPKDRLCPPGAESASATPAAAVDEPNATTVICSKAFN